MKLFQLITYSSLAFILSSNIASADEVNSLDDEAEAVVESRNVEAESFDLNQSEDAPVEDDADALEENDSEGEAQTSGEDTTDKDVDSNDNSSEETNETPPNLDDQFKQSDEVIIEAVGKEDRPSDLVETDVAEKNDDTSEGKSNEKKDEHKKEDDQKLKELPNTGIHENIEILFGVEIILLAVGLLLLFKKSSKVKYRK